MKDAEYLKMLRKINPNFVKHMKFIIKAVFPHSKKLETIHSSIIFPNDFFQALSLYQSSKQKTIPQDDLAYVVAAIILSNQFLLKSNIGKKWLKRFDEFYLSALDRTPTLKEATKNLYLKNIERTKNEIWTSTDKEVIDKTLYIILHNPEVYFHRLNLYAEKTKGRISADKDGNKKSLGAHAKDNLTSAIVSLYIHNENFRNDHYSSYEKWTKGQNALRKPIQDKYLTNKPTERQSSAYVTYKKVIEKRNALEDGSPEKLLLTLYSDIPPARSDYYDTKIYKEAPQNPDTGNYVILEKIKGEIVLNNYKTSKKYGQIRIDLPEELLRQLHLSLEKEPRTHLFQSERFKKPYTELKDPSGSFNSWANKTLKKIFNEDFTLTMLRHIYITRRDLKLEEQSGTERDKIARIMGHRVEQQQRYMWHRLHLDGEVSEDD
jgi:hypothetical protein